MLKSESNGPFESRRKREIRRINPFQNSTAVVGCLPGTARRAPVLKRSAGSLEAALSLGQAEGEEVPVEAVATRRNQTRIGAVAKLIGDVANFSVRTVG